MPKNKPTLTPEQRTLRARIAANTRWAKHDPVQGTATMRAKFLDTFLAQVDAETPGLPEPERQRRAESLKRAHFQRLALKSAKARSKKRDIDAASGDAA